MAEIIEHSVDSRFKDRGWNLHQAAIAVLTADLFPVDSYSEYDTFVANTGAYGVLAVFATPLATHVAEGFTNVDDGRKWIQKILDEDTAIEQARPAGENDDLDPDDDRDELSQADAVAELIKAIRAGWSVTDDFTFETVSAGGQQGIAMDLPPFGQTIYITVDIQPSV